MNAVSLVGLLAILGLAWALSYHRGDVRVRTVLWGLGLQFVFAVIILREDAWSYVGMVVLGGLIATYLLRGDATGAGRTPGGIAARLAVVVGVSLAAYHVVGGYLGWLALAVLVPPALDARFRFLPAAAKGLPGALFLGLGVAWLTANGIYGQVIFQALSAKVSAFLNLSDFGAQFMFGNLADPQYASTPPALPGRASRRSSLSRCCRRSSSSAASWRSCTTSG